EFWGKCAFWCWFIGFYVTFMPMYVLGFMGMTRRLQSTVNPAYEPLLLIAAAGAFIVGAGILCQIIQVAVSIRDRKKTVDLTGDPWNARTLEWATPSPPPFYNFAVVPKADELDAFHEAKKRGLPPPPKKYAPIHMPKNPGVPLILNIWILVLCFALVWHIWWMAAASFIA
ncbi:cbb3-type cytochrome c oxidase subunit I, partial [Enterobacter hormaechei]|uniref:cbb3-type cytochrome c oxidase subunit I n=1 Tax=Enterobacter hormaechei TaxID=158836 RepID=UPI00200BF804